MSKHLNALQKEVLVRKYKSNPKTTLKEFCSINSLSVVNFRRWLEQYEGGGLEGLARADANLKGVLPQGVEPTKEAYKREILRLRIENERLKKNYTVQVNESGQMVYIPLKMKSSE